MQQRKLPFRDSHRVAADSSERKSMGKHTEQEEEDSIEQDGDPNLRPGEAGSDQPTIASRLTSTIAAYKKRSRGLMSWRGDVPVGPCGVGMAGSK
jgi:hypothetical protein